MKKFLMSITIMLCISGTIAAQDNYVKGHFKKDGTYVEGYYKTPPNKTNTDNYATTPNVNPYTEKKGSEPADYTPQAQDKVQDKIIYTGPKGGQYYINDNGKKVYVPKTD